MKKNPETVETTQVFEELMKGVKPITQDKVVFKRQPYSTAKSSTQGAFTDKKVNASFEFSDGFEAYNDDQSVISYKQQDGDNNELKKLKRGHYQPDLILDLHGLNREQSKQEIAALLYAAVKKRCFCISVMHGKGNRVLKQAVPNWLVQHPNVMAFHQAPKQWGGESALLVLIKLPAEDFTLLP